MPRFSGLFLLLTINIMEKSAASTTTPYLNPLKKYAKITRFDDRLEELKNLALDESWEYKRSPNTRKYPILANYLIHTFCKAEDDKLIIESGKYSCFNTGLVTKNQQEIFMLFKQNDDKSRFFISFCKESDPNMNRFNTLPQRVTYFDDVTELLYDYRMPLRINIDHIIEDPENYKRFPDDIKNLPKHQIINTFHGAIEHAKKRVQRNYLTAIPQYFRGKGLQKGNLQLLLPLCFSDPSKADLALAVYKSEGAYMGRTCLTLDMAMNNARLITRPDDEWLRP